MPEKEELMEPSGGYGKALARERRLLQQTTAVLGCIPVGVAVWHIISGPAVIDPRFVEGAFASHFRYLSGLLLAIGLLFWSTVPAIEHKANRFRILTLIVFVGGLARLLGLLMTGQPGLGMMGGLVMELVITPLLCLWQTRVASKCAAARELARESPPQPPTQIEAPSAVELRQTGHESPGN
jgi:hypothetical protein